MTLTVVPPVRSRRPVRRGWRPRYPGEFPTLGWEILDWLSDVLPSPRNDREQLRLTDEQARRVLRIYELDPVTCRRLVRRVHEEEAKGWGKDPFGGILAIAEFCGPVLPDGWDADGQPVGRPWGTLGSPPPWIQIAGFSEAQTMNTWLPMYGLLRANDGKAADLLRIDEGRTRLYRRDMPDAFMERVTSSAGSREGQPITHSTVTEPQSLDESNGGDVLVRTVIRNLTKNAGWVHFLGNAPVTGVGTVAEEWWDEPGTGVYRFATRPAGADAWSDEQKREVQNWTDAEKLAALAEVYRDVPWMLEHLDRVLADTSDSTVPWGEALRFSYNVRTSGLADNAWMPPEAWRICAGKPVLDVRYPVFAVVRIAHDHFTAAVAIAQLQGDQVALRVTTFPVKRTDDLVPVEELEAHVTALRKDYPARVLMAKRFHPKGKEHHVQVPGPEIVYGGSFFEGSAQRLRAKGMALVDIPDTSERLAPAAETLRGLVVEQKLTHDGGSELGRQIGAVLAKEVAKGWIPAEAGPAARAAIVAVHRAMTAPRSGPSQLRRIRR